MSAPGVGTHPDLPHTFVHFTGRPRGAEDAPPSFDDEVLEGNLAELARSTVLIGRSVARAAGDFDSSDVDAEARLISILIMGKLKGAPVFGTSQPVICFSEPSEAARRIMLRDGVVASRGPYAPWGLLLDREALIAHGARPALYLSADELAATNNLPPKLRNRRVRYDPGSADWLHEREWRVCFDAEEPPELRITPDLVAGVIVNRQGWAPPLITKREPIELRPGLTVERVWASRSAHGLNRWWWTGEDLVHDGTINLDEPAP
ncbi:hypothetical protein R8Z50_21970 [Longispora sp. K20-0274]|uniref:hypothetical protein n=1 Tax=Longispora sp. K20-0274 TaxID=3088255 RepID=UPI0039997584